MLSSWAFVDSMLSKALGHFCASSAPIPQLIPSVFQWYQGTRAELNKITMPFLTFHSRTDEYTDPEGSQYLFDEAQSTDKDIVWVDDMWHALHSEPGNEKIQERVIEWITSRC